MLDSYLSALCQYAVRTGLIQTDDVVCCRNALLSLLLELGILHAGDLEVVGVVQNA